MNDGPRFGCAGLGLERELPGAVPKERAYSRPPPARTDEPPISLAFSSRQTDAPDSAAVRAANSPSVIPPSAPCQRRSRRCRGDRRRPSGERHWKGGQGRPVGGPREEVTLTAAAGGGCRRAVVVPQGSSSMTERRRRQGWGGAARSVCLPCGSRSLRHISSM